jgi:hypothetical protein
LFFFFSFSFPFFSYPGGTVHLHRYRHTVRLRLYRRVYRRRSELQTWRRGAFTGAQCGQPDVGTRDPCMSGSACCRGLAHVWCWMRAWSAAGQRRHSRTQVVQEGSEQARFRGLLEIYELF